MGEIKALTSLRGIFAIWVVLFHMTVWSPVPIVTIPIISRGYLAVDFFFMLSGFILARAHANEFEGRFSAQLNTYVRFVIKRITRLFPLHLTVLAIVLLVLASLGTPLYWWAYIVEEAMLAHRWGIHAPKGAINGPDWSISTELAVNLLFPFFVTLVWRAKIMAPIIGGTVLVGLIILAGSNGWSLDIAMANSLLPITRCACEFALGMLACRYLVGLKSLGSNGVAIILATGLTGLLLFRQTDIAVVSVMWLLLVNLAHDSGQLATALSARPMQWLGKVSYSIYLVQVPVIEWAREIALHFNGTALILAIYITLTIPTILIISSIAYAQIEKKGQIVGKLTLSFVTP